MDYGQKLKILNKMNVFIFILLILLVLLIVQHKKNIKYYIFQNINYPINCNTAHPKWLKQLIPQLKENGYIGVQMSYVSSNLEQINCSIGWASLFPLRQMRNHDQLKYASLSKIFTSTLILQLIQQGKLQFNDHILEILKIPHSQDPNLTHVNIRHLLQHRAGFDKQKSGDLVFEKPEICPEQLYQLATLHLDFKPDQKFAYSNFGYCLLGEVIHHQDLNQDLISTYKNQLFLPAKTNIQHIQNTKGTVNYFYHENDSKIQPAFNYKNSTAYGGFVGSATDFSKVLHFIMEQPYFYKQLTELDPHCDLTKWQNCHGLAMYGYKEKGGKTVYWRDGSLPGMSAMSMYFDDHSSIVILTNYRGFNPKQDHQKLARLLYKILK